MRLKDITAKAVEDGIDEELLPSWSKFNEAPVKARGFWTYMLQAVFEGKHNSPHMDAELQFEAYGELKVAMIFLGKIRNEALELASKYASDALRGYTVVPVYGGTTTNKKAERHVREQIEVAHRDNKNVLIVAANMAQRSFSVPEITELYLAYDKGAEGATVQKMSRGLTPDTANPDKVGRIISMSFDPNRDDKFDAMIVQTAYNHNKKYNKKDLRESMKDVLSTIDIFRCQDFGRDQVEIDEYLVQLLARKTGLSRVIGKTADMSKLTEEDIIALANGSVEPSRATKTEKAQAGKTRKSLKKRNARQDDSQQWEKLLAKAKATMAAIAENVDILVLGTGSTSIHEALEFVAHNADYANHIALEFDIEYHVIDFLFRSGALNENLLQLTWNNNS